MKRARPPFRADHVGSLLRPPELLRAREDFAAGDDRRSGPCARSRTTRSARRCAEQEAAGLQAATRRRAPPRLLAHGLHLPDRRHQQRGRTPRGDVPQRAGRHRVHARGAARRLEARHLEDDLRRRLRLPPGRRDANRPEADDPVAEHGPLPRRQGGDRSGGVRRPGALLGRPDGRLCGTRCGGWASSAAPTCSSTTRASRT